LSVAVAIFIITVILQGVNAFASVAHLLPLMACLN